MGGGEGTCGWSGEEEGELRETLGRVVNSLSLFFAPSSSLPPDCSPSPSTRFSPFLLPSLQSAQLLTLLVLMARVTASNVESISVEMRERVQRLCDEVGERGG